LNGGINQAVSLAFMRRRPSVTTGKARRPDSHGGGGGGVIAGDYAHEE
jgi:hypothetical protein